MGNVVTRIKHHKPRHVHQDVVVSVPVDGGGFGTLVFITSAKRLHANNME
jgi:hypothetical protein